VGGEGGEAGEEAEQWTLIEMEGGICEYGFYFVSYFKPDADTVGCT
jgi:hypothetical protein